MSGTFQLPPQEDNPHWPMPVEYEDADKAERREMRKALLQSWFDEDRPGKAITEPELFLVALNFFVDFYLKRARACRHQYFMPDCRHKPTMQRMLTHPRSALVAPRESGKTFALIHEACPFIAITRPNTPILIGSETAELTEEKLKEIRRRIEGNGLLLADWGDIYPKARSSVYDWRANCLDFLNGSSIRGSSIDAATRGRHPLFGIIDDPEGKLAKNKSWRDKFMRWLFRDYLNQFRDKDTHVMWIGTLLQIDSCLWRAVHNEDEENRFIGWRRHILKMVYEDENGEMVSAWPEKMTVAEFERKIAGRDDEDGTITPIGMAAVMAEFQGEPIPAGQQMFRREERKHGYLFCEHPDGTPYIYDPCSGHTIEWEEFTANCYKYGGVDIADTPSRTADASAIVIGFYDPDGMYWIVDAWADWCFSDNTTVQAMRMCDEWKVSKLAWESVSLGRRIYREAWKVRQKRLAEGFHVPVLVPLLQQGIDKTLRIERMRPDFDAGLLRFPLFKAMDGHKPRKHPRIKHLKTLIDQLDTMTGEGAVGNDDLLDAMEMMHRVADRKPHRQLDLPTGQKLLQQWEDRGVHVDPMQTPQDNWTKAMREEWKARIAPVQEDKSRGLERVELFG